MSKICKIPEIGCQKSGKFYLRVEKKTKPEQLILGTRRSLIAVQDRMITYSGRNLYQICNNLYYMCYN